MPQDKLELETASRRALQDYRDTIKAYRREIGDLPTFMLDGPAPTVPVELVRNCKFLPSRQEIISNLPKDGIAAEVGTQTGRFALSILELNSPRKLFTIDIDYSAFAYEEAKQFINDGRLVLREGVSWEVLSSFDDETFDFIYIDADHSYEAVSRDLEVSIMKLKPGGHIVCNDFICWSALEGMKYGVYKAVCEFAIERQLPFTHFALHPFCYFDVAMKKP